MSGRRAAKTDFEIGKPVSGQKTESGAGVAVGGGATVGAGVAVAGAAAAVGAESRVGSGLRVGGADEQAATKIENITVKTRLIESPSPKKFCRHLPESNDNTAPLAANDSESLNCFLDSIPDPKTRCSPPTPARRRHFQSA
jgi:hypothetical protein